VDGSNAILLDAGCYAIAAFRAAESSFEGGQRAHSGQTPLCMAAIGPERECRDYEDLYAECFQIAPENTLTSEDPLLASGVLRDTLEYWIALRLANHLEAGDVLVLDGALSVSHASHQPILMDLLKLCGWRGIHLAAVTKRSSLTWGAGLPLVPAVAGLAERCPVDSPWYVAVPDDLLESPRFREWKQGAIYVARLHPKAEATFKVELPRYAKEEAVDRTFSALARYSDDGRITGYPFPLLEAHRMAKIGKDSVEQLQQDLIAKMCGAGMRLTDYKTLFGDVHDAFDRY
ncbi:MAG TPA: DNA double-strand break repair nuclease NurA, partial [Methanomicrobiales archaeon]|nr:DNA double-strand break repair nuclease NurA [Methanomicrobiales archaeon]